MRLKFSYSINSPDIKYLTRFNSPDIYSPDIHLPYPIGSMYAIYMVTWIPSIYPLYVSIYTSTMDPMGMQKHD